MFESIIFDDWNSGKEISLKLIELNKESTVANFYLLVDNFENLLHAWSQPNPKDYFYFKVFGKTFAEKQIEDEITDMSAYEESDKGQTLEEKVEAMV